MDSVERTEAAKIALDEFRKCSAIYPAFEDAYYEMGGVYRLLNDNINAIKMYKRTLEINPDNTKALADYATLLFINKDYKNALDGFKKVMQKNPNDVKSFVAAGACYREMKEYNNAINFFEKALQLKPGDVNLAKNLSLLYLNVNDSIKADYYDSLAVNH